MLNLQGLVKAPADLIPNTGTDTSAAKPANFDLQIILLDMQRYGKPRLHCHDNNAWSCHIDVSVSQIGAKFEVRSDFTQKTPIAAAVQCNERLIEALSSIVGKTL